MSLANVSR